MLKIRDKVILENLEIKADIKHKNMHTFHLFFRYIIIMLKTSANTLHFFYLLKYYINSNFISIISMRNM